MNTEPQRTRLTDADVTADCDTTDDSIIDIREDTATAPEDHLVIYVQLRAPNGKIAEDKFKATLEAVQQEHPTVAVNIDGYSTDERYLRITLGINCGDRRKIARFSEEATASYEFASAIFTKMFMYLPQYVAAPSSIERDNAARWTTGNAAHGAEVAA